MRFKSDSLAMFGGVTAAVLIIAVLGARSAGTAALFAVRLAAPPLNWSLGGAMAVLDRGKQRRIRFPVCCLAGALLTISASLLLEAQLAVHVPEYGGVGMFILAYALASAVLVAPQR
ncbi:MAG TPA: hypothetical protein VGE07_18865 [Herpetosiphonaceae bacterium]